MENVDTNTTYRENEIWFDFVGNVRSSRKIIIVLNYIRIKYKKKTYNMLISSLKSYHLSYRNKSIVKKSCFERGDKICINVEKVE